MLNRTEEVTEGPGEAAAQTASRRRPEPSPPSPSRPILSAAFSASPIQTVTASGSSLSYHAANDSYTYVWKTQQTWIGCRKLTLTFTDGSVQKAIFQLKR